MCYPFLDILRFAAALIVVCHHYLPAHNFGKGVPGGYLAVDLFFQISGFVVAAHYGASSLAEVSPYNFWLARLRRLLPMFATSLILIGVQLFGRLAFGNSLTEVSFNQLAISIAGIAFCLPSPLNYAIGHGSWPWNPPVWSLFYEVVFTVLGGWWLLRRSSVTLGLVSFVCFCALAFASFFNRTLDFGVFLFDFPFASARILFGFCVGILIWRVFGVSGRNSAKLSFGLLVLLSVGLSGFSFVATWFLYGDELDRLVVLVLLLFPALLVASFYFPFNALERYSRFLAELSFGLYLLHWPLYPILRQALSRFGLYAGESLVGFFQLGILGFISTIALMLLVERPIRKFYRR